MIQGGSNMIEKILRWLTDAVIALLFLTPFMLAMYLLGRGI